LKKEQKFKSIDMRKKGFSVREISEKLGISKSTASTWVRSVPVSEKGEKRLHDRVVRGRLASINSIRLKTKLKETHAKEKAVDILKEVKFNKCTSKLLCAMIYHCEGGKRISDGISFTNSDPQLVSSFLLLFRESFELNERKLRVCVHLHAYHDINKQLKFWSKITNIPIKQFIKPFHKQNLGLYPREEYQGCARVRYCDATIAREIKAIAVEFMNSYSGL
jgi:transposase